MTTTKKALGIAMLPDGTVTIDMFGTDLESIKAVVGGWIEYVHVADGLHAYVDEEGKIKGRDINGLASGTIRDAYRQRGERFGDWIVGPAIFFGDAGDGKEGDVPQWFVDYVTEWVIDGENDEGSE